MRKRLALLVFLAGSSGALAHDFWIQPHAFAVPDATPLEADILVGHGEARQRTPISPDRIVRFTTIGPAGETDQRAGLHLGAEGSDATLTLSGPGTHIATLETNNTSLTLPAIRFNDYLAEEGLAAVIAARAAAGAENTPGRELYSRRAKTVVVVGDGPLDGRATGPLGLTLEIVPLADPVALQAGGSLPVTVFFSGAPLPGALVKLTDLGNDAEPVATAVTDATGRAAFTIPHAGAWLLNVVWSVPATNTAEADYLTVFSSLSFAID